MVAAVVGGEGGKRQTAIVIRGQGWLSGIIYTYMYLGRIIIYSIGPGVYLIKFSEIYFLLVIDHVHITVKARNFLYVAGVVIV